MRIASFNLENLGEDDGPAAVARHDVLRPQLERIDADILCLQEIDAARGKGDDKRRTLGALEELLAGTAYAGFHRTTTLRSSTGEPRDRHNLVILSRWPIEKAEQFSNDLVEPALYEPTTAEPRAGPRPITWERPIQHAVIALGTNARLHVVNLHLKAPLASFIPGQKIGPFAWKSVAGWAEGYFVAAMKRAGQALEARILIDKIFDSDPAAMIAICGDFNAQQKDVAFEILAGDTEDTGNGALTVRELIPLENSIPESQRFTVIHGGRRMMLDHILVSRALLGHYRGVEIHNEALGDELIAYTTIAGTPESYHAPVVATFSLGA
ncbi:MAG: endonuclease/exonuclease/phosphatase family protein [Alphaproteobacteria bacterium]|nr:endonuclease/exonuclease/phosphatase family protein [Alphaproteobacteria bacterium]